jgi:hypothetical protein
VCIFVHLLEINHVCFRSFSYHEWKFDGWVV